MLSRAKTQRRKGAKEENFFAPSRLCARLFLSEYPAGSRERLSLFPHFCTGIGHFFAYSLFSLRILPTFPDVITLPRGAWNFGQFGP